VLNKSPGMPAHASWLCSAHLWPNNAQLSSLGLKKLQLEAGLSHLTQWASPEVTTKQWKQFGPVASLPPNMDSAKSLPECIYKISRSVVAMTLRGGRL
jgi:hypothetical protein